MSIPNSDSISKLAEFWQIHELTDFDYELEEVDEPVFRRSRVESELSSESAASA
jgi:hypothetical protein